MAKMSKKKIFKALGLVAKQKGANYGGEWFATSKQLLEVRSPTSGQLLATVEQASARDYTRVMQQSQKAFVAWRAIPAPKRGEIVRQVGEALREKKDALGALVSLEMGKILTEGLGEVQEMIDICDFAVGQSRFLSGPTLQSERPDHRMMEQWHPLGTVGVISAFNFPVAVWAWNTALAWICGDTALWKPSSKAPLCGVACQNIVNEVFKRNKLPMGISAVVIGRGSTIGEKLIGDKRVPLVSATGSTRMGKRIGEVVGARLGRTILELGGNNALIISDKADLTGALASSFFGAVGTAGQRCTSTRRLIIHEKVYDTFIKKLIANYKKVRIGDPLDPKTLMGPLIDEGAVKDYENAIIAAKAREGAHTAVRTAHVRATDDHRHRELGGDRPARDFRADPVRHEVPPDRRGVQTAQRRTAGSFLGDLQRQRGRGRGVPELLGLGLRYCQCQHRHQRCGDRRCLRRREGDRRWPRIGFRLLEGLYAAADQHHQLGWPGPSGPGGGVPELALPGRRGCATPFYCRDAPTGLPRRLVTAGQFRSRGRPLPRLSFDVVPVAGYDPSTRLHRILLVALVFSDERTQS